MKEIKERPPKSFSGYLDLPDGDAPDVLLPGCMVLEGGAFRAVYGEGVLDALMEEGINLSCTVGVSAGAMNGYVYVAGQIGRAARVNLGYRHDKRYVGRTAYKNNKSILGFDFVFYEYPKRDPVNEERFYRDDRRFVAVATNCLTGEPCCFEKGQCSDILQAIRASASMPYISKPVTVDGIPCLDGGCSVKVPFQWALDEGFEKIVVVRTRPQAHRRKESSFETRMAGLFYHKYPELAKALKTGPARANEECDTMERLAREGRIFLIAPSEDLGVGRVESDMEKLGAQYYLGYRNGKAALPALRSYLNC